MKRIKKNLLALLLLALPLLMPACGNTKTSPAGDMQGRQETAAAEKPQKDRSGAKIAIPDDVDTVAALAPSIAETLIDLGCAETVAAIDTLTQSYGYGQLAPDLPVFDMMAPDTEQLAALKPDIVFISGVTDIGGTDLYADLKELGVCVVNIPSSDSIQGVKDDIAFIAACMGKTEEGDALIADMAGRIDRIAKIGETITERKTVYFEIAAIPYAYSFGSGTFLNEMLEIIGADNVLAGQEGWLPVEPESIVAANPDVILTNVNYLEDAVGEIRSRSGWEGVSAVADGAVYLIDNKSSSLPNENIVKALEEMAKAVYPEAYGE